jgi:hypothetical protein
MGTPQDPPYPLSPPPFPVHDPDAPPDPDEDEPPPVPLPSAAAGYNVIFMQAPDPEKHLAEFVQWLYANDGRLRQTRPSKAKLAPKDGE